MVEKMSDLGQNSRASTALSKRQEAVKRWGLSDTAKEPSHRHSSRFRIFFDKGTVFLSAIASADLDESEKLLEEGVDINFANVDGLTALHQACIDENMEMVEMLVKNGADIEATDNEGWTPLHAAVSAGNVEIAQYLIEKGADMLAVNNEGEVPIDLAEEEEMEEFIQDEIEKRGVEVDSVRDEEERKMLEDANCWLNSSKLNEPPDRQGATSLHVAAAKGYLQVISILLQAGADVNARDTDGWTPLHAAIHWGQKQAAETLVDNGADFSVRNGIGQTPCDIAEGEMIKISEELRKKAKEIAKDGVKRSSIIAAGNGPPQMKRRISSDVNDNDLRSSITRIKDKSLGLTDKQQERQTLEALQYSGVPSADARPNRSALKGARKAAAAIKNKDAVITNNDTKEKSESEESDDEDYDDDDDEDDDDEESETESSESEPEPVKKPEIAKPVLPSPLRPGGGPLRPGTSALSPVQRPSSTFSLKAGPLRPSQMIAESSRPDTKPETPSSRLTSTRLGRKEEEDTKTSDVLSRYRVARPGRTSVDENGKDKTKEETTSSRFSIPRPSRPDTDDTSRTSSLGSSRLSRTETKDTDTKDTTTVRKESKAEELRAKFNVMRPGDTSSSTYTSRFRARKESDNEEPNSASSRIANRLNRRGDDSDEKKEVNGGEVRKQDEDSSSATLRTRTSGYQSGNTSRLSRTFGDKEKTDNDVSYLSRRNRTTEDEKPKAEDTTSSSLAAFRRGRAEREREAEREKEREAEKLQKLKEEKERLEKEKQAEKEAADDSKSNNDDDDSSNLSAQRARRSRKPRERRRATGVAYMPEEEQPQVNQNETKRNTKSNEEPETGSTPINVSRVSSTNDDTESTHRLSVSERLRRNNDSTISSSRNKITIDTSDPKELKKRLEEVMMDLQDYKSKLDCVVKDKENLEKKLKDYDEEIKKIQELKNDNARLKDENGALIRVISKLSRTPAS